MSWQKSTYSSGDGNTNCIELAVTGGNTLHLRESEEPDNILKVPHQALDSLLSHIKTQDHGIRVELAEVDLQQW